MSFVNNTISVFITSVLKVLLSVLGGVIVARYLSLEERSYYGIIINFIGLLVVFTNCGWPSAVIVRIGRSDSLIQNITGATLWAAGLFSVVAILICLLFQDKILTEFLSIKSADLYLIALMVFPCQLLSGYLCGIARGLHKFNIHNAYHLTIQFITTCIIVIVLVVLNHGVAELMRVLLLCNVLVTLILLWVIISKTDVNMNLKNKDFVPILKFGFKNWIHALAGNVHIRIDVFMLSSIYLFGDHKQIAFYIQAVAVLHIVRIFPDAIQSTMLPHLSGLKKEALIRECTKAFRHGVFITLIVVIGFSLIANRLVPFLYGDKYVEALVPLHILLPSMVFHTAYQLLLRFWVVLDKQRVNIIIQFIAMIFNIVLNYALIPKYGIKGAAISSAITYFFEGVIMIALFKRYTNQHFLAIFQFNRNEFEIYFKKINIIKNKYFSS